MKFSICLIQRRSITKFCDYLCSSHRITSLEDAFLSKESGKVIVGKILQFTSFEVSSERQEIHLLVREVLPSCEYGEQFKAVIKGQMALQFVQIHPDVGDRLAFNGSRVFYNPAFSVRKNAPTYLLEIGLGSTQELIYLKKNDKMPDNIQDQMISLINAEKNHQLLDAGNFNNLKPASQQTIAFANPVVELIQETSLHEEANQTNPQVPENEEAEEKMTSLIRSKTNVPTVARNQLNLSPLNQPEESGEVPVNTEVASLIKTGTKSPTLDVEQNCDNLTPTPMIRPSKYTFESNKIQSMTLESIKKADIGKGGADRAQVIGVVNQILKPLSTTPKGKSTIILTLVDETTGAANEFRCHFFTVGDRILKLIEAGDILRLQKVKLEMYNNEIDGRVFNNLDILIYKQNSTDLTPIMVSSKTIISERERKRVQVLKTWYTDNKERLTEETEKINTERESKNKSKTEDDNKNDKMKDQSMSNSHHNQTVMQPNSECQPEDKNGDSKRRKLLFRPGTDGLSSRNESERSSFEFSAKTIPEPIFSMESMCDVVGDGDENMILMNPSPMEGLDNSKQDISMAEAGETRQTVDVIKNVKVLVKRLSEKDIEIISGNIANENRKKSTLTKENGTGSSDEMQIIGEHLVKKCSTTSSLVTVKKKNLGDMSETINIRSKKRTIESASKQNVRSTVSEQGEGRTQEEELPSQSSDDMPTDDDCLLSDLELSLPEAESLLCGRFRAESPPSQLAALLLATNKGGPFPVMGHVVNIFPYPFPFENMIKLVSGFCKTCVSLTIFTELSWCETPGTVPQLTAYCPSCEISRGKKIPVILTLTFSFDIVDASGFKVDHLILKNEQAELFLGCTARDFVKNELLRTIIYHKLKNLLVDKSSDSTIISYKRPKKFLVCPNPDLQLLYIVGTKL